MRSNETHLLSETSLKVSRTADLFPKRSPVLETSSILKNLSTVLKKPKEKSFIISEKFFRSRRVGKMFKFSFLLIVTLIPAAFNQVKRKKEAEKKNKFDWKE